VFGVFEGIRRKDVFRPDIVITKEATDDEYPHFVLEVPKKARVQKIKLTSEIGASVFAARKRTQLCSDVSRGHYSLNIFFKCCYFAQNSKLYICECAYCNNEDTGMEVMVMVETVKIGMKDLKNMRYRNETWKRVFGDRVPIEVIDISPDGITVRVIDEKDLPKDSKPDYILTGSAVIEELASSLPYFYDCNIAEKDEIPDWADGVVITVRGLVKPVKKSKYNENEYYTKENWKTCKISRKTYLEVIRRYIAEKKFSGGYFILLKDRELQEATLVRENGIYEVYRITS